VGLRLSIPRFAGLVVRISGRVYLVGGPGTKSLSVVGAQSKFVAFGC
jgi:hypothetical protein